MPERRTTDIALPRDPGVPPDPTIPARAARQADLALQKGSRDYEHPENRPAGAPRPLTLRKLGERVAGLPRPRASRSALSSR